MHYLGLRLNEHLSQAFYKTALTRPRPQSMNADAGVEARRNFGLAAQRNNGLHSAAPLQCIRKPRQGQFQPTGAKAGHHMHYAGANKRWGSFDCGHCECG